MSGGVDRPTFPEPGLPNPVADLFVQNITPVGGAFDATVHGAALGDLWLRIWEGVRFTAGGDVGDLMEATTSAVERMIWAMNGREE